MQIAGIEYPDPSSPEFESALKYIKTVSAMYGLHGVVQKTLIAYRALVTMSGERAGATVIALRKLRDEGQ